MSKPSPGAEEALKERQRTLANYRRLKKVEWQEMVVEEPRLEWLASKVRKCRDPIEMVMWARIASAELTEKYFPIALSLFGQRIAAIRQRQGYDPFDDPLPPELGGEDDDVDCFQQIRRILT